MASETTESRSGRVVLEIRDLEKSYVGARREGPVLAVKGVSLEVREGEMFTLLGPSGCGKTTTLRCVAGLETPSRGSIKVGDRTLFSLNPRTNVAANRRGLGMVFQSYAIWPHLDVQSNAAFPLIVKKRRERPSSEDIRARVNRVLEVVQMDHLASRRSTDLSGGQQQRLALARALILEPPLLLLDEPLSNLDAKLREDMRLELRRLQVQIGITTLYVTHDQAEALAISSRLAVMNAGVIEQIGTPEEVYARPASRFVAEFIGTMNFIRGKVRAGDAAATVIETGAGNLTVPGPAIHAPGTAVAVAIRPENFALQAGDDRSGQEGWSGRVVGRVFMGEAVEYLVESNATRVRVRCPASHIVQEGESVSVRVDTRAAIVYPE